VPWALRRDHLDGTDFEVSEDYLEGKRGVEMELVLAGLIQKHIQFGVGWPGSYKNTYNSASAGGINTETNTIRRRLAGFVQKHIQFGTDGCIHREINTIRYNSVQFGVQFLHR
jgi:hypothetical protein